ncbi:MAG: DUF342 domain-containing protein [Spirochaetales bacterium]|nr:DUF342 domain-containing protein [Spirochaetales bacterium]
MSTEGTFEIYYKDGYACLTVYPKSDTGRTVYPEEIIGRLKILEIHSVRRQKIMDILEEESGEPVPVAPWPEGEKLGPLIVLDVAEDRMSASITISPEKQGGEPLSVQIISRYLKSKQIIYGVEEKTLQTMVLKQIYNQPVKVAFGRPPVDEKPPIPEYFFETDRGRPFKELEFQRIDLKELNFIQNMKAGSLLAELGKPIDPKDGTDIFGKTIAAERGAERAPFTAGPGTQLTDDEKQIIATIDGNAKLKDNTVIMEPLISVENVDYSNGNMDFNGSIDVAGRVADGFKLKAMGDVQIGKSVSRVDILSGGDVILKAGISGNDEGKILCEGDLYARYIENATIICKGNIFVEEAIMHSEVKAGGDIILTGKRAEIFGRRLLAGGSVKCKKLGSINEPVTELFLGIDLDTFSRLEGLQNSVKNNTDKINKLDTQIRQIKTALKKRDNPEFSAEKLSAALQQLEMESGIINTKLSDSVRLLHELKRNIILNETSSLSAEEQIYGKVHVFFNNLRWDSPTKGTGKTMLNVIQGRLLEK